MRRLFRPRNLLILAILGVVAGVVLSKRNAAPAPTYTDPWATPTSTDTSDGEAAEAGTAGSNGNGGSATSDADATESSDA
jgi:hypothetical protein